MMKVFQLENQPCRLYFTNYERRDESIIFQEVYKKLLKTAKVIIGTKTTGPSEDLYECSIDNRPFSLIYDLDYGVEIYSKDMKAVEKLSKLFNKN